LYHQKPDIGAVDANDRHQIKPDATQSVNDASRIAIDKPFARLPKGSSGYS
jgi:hypothetical protein